MKSSARFWALTACVVVVSAGLKAALHPYRVPVADNPVAMTEALGGFLTRQGVADITLVPTLRMPGKWNGWRFSTAGCPALAFPAPLSGEMDDAAVRHAGAGDTVRFIEQGRVTARPSRVRATVRHTLLRASRALGLGGGREVFYVVLIHPAGCDAAARLNWGAL